MDPQAAKFIGAGLAAMGTGAAAIGVGTLFGHFLNGALRNPSAVGRAVRSRCSSAFGPRPKRLGIFAFLVAILLLFADEVGR